MVERKDRPIVPHTHADEREHRRLLSVRANAAFPKDGTEGMTAPLKVMPYVVADQPDATLFPGAIIHDDTDNVPAYSDGVTWNPLATEAGVAVVQAEVDALEAVVVKVLATGTVSGGAIDVPLDSAGYSAYHVFKLIVYNLTVSVDGDSVYLRISDDGGATFEADAADYQWAFIDTTAGAVEDQSDSEVHLCDSVGNAAGEFVSVEITIMNPASATKTGIIWAYQRMSNATAIRAGNGAGAPLVAAATTDVRVLASTGNITGKWTLVGIT